MINLCYLCGKPATKPLKLKDSFTAHSAARVPKSNKICDRCDWSINLRCFYFNPNKQKWSKLFSRNWSWLFQGDRLIAPTISGTHTEGKDTLQVVTDLPTRAQLREWLINPPEPPFTLAIAESGQKHILFLAQEAHDRDCFPVQFETDSLFLKHHEFVSLLEIYEALMGLGFSKTEIDSGEYRSDRLLPSLIQWEPLENQIAPFRGSRLLGLASYVAMSQKADGA